VRASPIAWGDYLIRRYDKTDAYRKEKQA